MRRSTSICFATLFLEPFLVVGSVMAQPAEGARFHAAVKGNEVQGSSGEDTSLRDKVKPSGETSQYIIGAADVIRINVWKNNDLSQTVTVGPDGFVSLPLLGDVHVAGMTASQLAEELAGRFNGYVVSAQVTVSLVEIRSRQIYVMGQVGKPGSYPLIGPLTVLQAIAQAGGLNTFAHRKSVLVLRGTGSNAQRLKFNYVAALQGGESQNIVLQPGDTVVVP